MYDVYINHFKQGNTTVDTEQLMFSIPSQSGFSIQRPNVRCSEDSAESFSFTMDSDSPYYDAILPLKTLFRVVYDGTTIFYGRATAPSTSTVYQTKNVTCEGWYALLNDTYYEGVQEKYRNKISVSAYLDKIISNHNNMAEDKSITRGNVTSGLMPSDADKYEPTSWTQTSSLLSNMSSNFGGHMIVRYVVNNGSIAKYLDWYKYYERDLGEGLRPSVTVGRNILDISSESDVDSIFTRVIPIGDTNSSGKTIYISGYNGYSNKYMSVSYLQKSHLYTDEELTDEFHNYKDYRDAEDNYGIIYRTMTFSDCDTQAKLWNATKKWIKDSYFGMATSFTVKAVDFHITDQNLPMILVGDCVDVTFPIVQNGIKQWITKKLVCKSASYDLFNPENNSYTFGIPSDLLDYNKNNKKSSKKKTASTAAAPSKAIPSGGEDNSITWHKVWQIIGAIEPDSEYGGGPAARSFYANGELSGDITAFDPDDIPREDWPSQNPNWDNFMPASDYDMKKYYFNAKLIGKITLTSDGTPLSTKWIAVSNNRGVFAYTSTSSPHPVKYWYLKKKVVYQETDPVISSFEKIAQMIQNDTDLEYGGQSNADNFRNNGQSNSTIKIYDLENTDTDPPTDQQYVFTANVVGRFTNGGNTIYVATSVTYGVFAFKMTRAQPPQKVAHWYNKVQGLKYDLPSNFIHNPDGSTSMTPDGQPGSITSLKLIPGPIEAGSSINGGMNLGYDIRGTGDKWKVKISLPFVYTDKNGNDQWVRGGVRASDFAIPDENTFKSIKANLAVLDAAVIGVVYANTISAQMAYIDNLRTTGGIVAGTHVSSANISANNIEASQTVTANDFYWPGNETIGGISLKRGLYGAQFGVDNEGVISLSFTRLDGSTYTPAGFNMANTAFFRTNVLAAENRGKNSVTITKGTWDTGIVQFNKSEGTASTSGVSLVVVDGLWDGTTHTSYIKDEYDSESNPIDTGKRVVLNVASKLTTLNATQNDTYTPPSPYFGFSSVTVNVSGGGSSDNGWNAARSIVINSLPTSSTEPINVGTAWNLKIPNSGYDSGSYNLPVTVSGLTDYTPQGSSSTIKVVNVKLGDYIAYRKEIKLQSKSSITPTTSDQTITCDSNYDALKQVVVAGDSNLVPSKIKSGTSIFGVSGTYSVDDVGWNAARDIIVNSLPSSSVAAVDSTYKLKIPKLGYNSGSDDLNLTVTGPSNYQPQGSTSTIKVVNVKLGDYIAYRKEIKLQAKTDITPTTTAQTITCDSGYHALSSVTVKGSSNLVASKIKSGVTIFGVKGTYSATSGLVKDDIQIDSYQTYSSEPTADATASNMKSVILGALKNKYWFRFRVYIKGTSPLVEKLYKMHFTQTDLNNL